MKRDYFVDFSKNIITVSRSFFEEAAKDTESAAHQKMLELRALGMNIKIAAKKRSKKGRLSYDKMQKFIDRLVDAKVYQDEFEAVRKVSKARRIPISMFSNGLRTVSPITLVSRNSMRNSM